MKPMQFEQRHFVMTPVIVPEGKKSTITIRGLGNFHQFFDDLDYQVRIIPKEQRDYLINDDFDIAKFNEECNIIDAKCENGVLTFEYTFTGEQEWCIALRTKNGEEDYLKYYNPWRVMFKDLWRLPGWENFRYDFRLYSLSRDLYELTPFKGDTHTHTDYSDGTDTPELFCAHYRGFGYDFAAITDHYEYRGSIRAVEKMKQLDTNFKVFLGEEVHVIPSGGHYHIVNFGGKSSVNERIISDYDNVKKEVFEAAKEYTHLAERDAQELAWIKWISDHIRQVGGLCICAHPFDTVYNAYNIPTNITYESIKRGYYDAYEILNCSAQGKNIQAMFYYDLQGQGIKIPIVGSTDAHHSTDHGEGSAAIHSTVVFAKTIEDVPEAIKNMMTTAVSHEPDQKPYVHGSFKLAKYTCFLMENYFPMHNELCMASSVLQREYFKGSTELKPAIELAEKRIKEYTDTFFGR